MFKIHTPHRWQFPNLKMETTHSGIRDKRRVKVDQPFRIEAIVVLPDHLCTVSGPPQVIKCLAQARRCRVEQLLDDISPPEAG
jgi:hypothetical protein